MEERKQQLLDMLKKHDITPTSGNTRVYQVLGCHLICCTLIEQWCVPVMCGSSVPCT